MTHAEPLSHWMALWLGASAVGMLVFAAQAFSRQWARSEREVEDAERVIARHQESTHRSTR